MTELFNLLSADVDPRIVVEIFEATAAQVIPTYLAIKSGLNRDKYMLTIEAASELQKLVEMFTDEGLKPSDAHRKAIDILKEMPQFKPLDMSINHLEGEAARRAIEELKRETAAFMDTGTDDDEPCDCPICTAERVAKEEQSELRKPAAEGSNTIQ